MDVLFVSGLLPMNCPLNFASVHFRLADCSEFNVRILSDSTRVSPNRKDCDKYFHLQTTIINEFQLAIAESPVRRIICVSSHDTANNYDTRKHMKVTPHPASQYANNQSLISTGSVIDVESVRMPTASAFEKQLDRVYVDMQTYTILKSQFITIYRQ
ncbi:hypothetical protein T265_07536 [Opisthorchis viverrini]|uniref:Uncharacterized protein n=1 Tax=Opisthorchis viverrini TaxID=6198 RepID=A0A075ABA2_OPIVI|nr:hypothetical protein T265_07536 [Opisthorchis viverrini]KER24914.1 hypothetical protein T265_07536 [Opisthorchis viverrini]